MDQENPARSALTSIPPAMLADMVNDPSLLRNIAIPMAAMQLDALHRLTLNPQLPTSQRIQIAEYTTKIAEIGAFAKTTAAVTPGTGFSVNIIMNQAPATKTVIEHVSVQDAVEVPIKESGLVTT